MPSFAPTETQGVLYSYSTGTTKTNYVYKVQYKNACEFIPASVAHDMM